MQVLPDVEVALDRRQRPDNSTRELFGPLSIYRVPIEGLELLDEDICEDQARLTSTQSLTLFATQVVPVNVCRVLDERVLHGAPRTDESHATASIRLASTDCKTRLNAPTLASCAISARWETSKYSTICSCLANGGRGTDHFPSVGALRLNLPSAAPEPPDLRAAEPTSDAA